MSEFARRRELAWLVGPLAAAVLMFLAAAGVSQWMGSRIERESTEMQVNSLPSVRELSAARTELTRIDTAALAAMTAGSGRRRAALEDMQRSRQAVDAHVASYSQTPWYPGERELYDRDLVPGLRQLEVDIDRAAAPPDGMGDGERLAAEAAIVADTNQVDRAVADLLDLNHDQSYAATSRILGERRTSMLLALALDGAAFVLAALLAAAAVHAWRRLRAVQVAHAALVEARARELEIFGQRIAHDVLSPLAAVSFTLAAIERQDPSEQTSRLVARGRSALGRSQQLVRGIFEFARSGARPVPNARASLGRAVREATDELAAANPEAPPVTIEHLDDVELACDESVLGVVLANLLGNAAKYSKDSPVQRVLVRTCHAGARRVRVEVEDFGPGIPPGLERTIFEPYVRAPGTEQPGLGLGLATVQRMVTTYGGDVGVRRKQDGAIFWFELPRAEGETVAPQPAPGDAGAVLH